jgi:hypothetical protein
MTNHVLTRLILAKMLKQKVAKNVAISLGYFSYQKSQLTAQNSPIGEKLPNSVTLFRMRLKGKCLNFIIEIFL